MSSQEPESNQLLLHNKDLRLLMGLTSRDGKPNKNALLKINISEALSVVAQASDQIEIRLYGNVIFSITQGILRTYNVINLDLKETIDLMRKNIKTEKKEVAPKIPKLTRPADKTHHPIMSSESESMSIEGPRNTSNMEEITRKGQASHPRDIEPGYGTPMDQIFPIEDDMGQHIYDIISDGKASSIKVPFDLSTPSQIEEFTSPKKPKQAFKNLDDYLDSVRKDEVLIFKEPEEEAVRKGRREQKTTTRKAKKVEFATDLETRWDYDEKTNVERPEEERNKTDANAFVNKVQAPPTVPIEQRLSVTLDHFLSAFSIAKLAQFGEKVKHIREDQIPEIRRHGTASKLPVADSIAKGSYRHESDIDIEVIPPASESSIHGAFFPVDQGGPMEILPPQDVAQELADKIEQERLEYIEASEILNSIKVLEEKKMQKNKKPTFEKLAKEESKQGKAKMFYELLSLAKENKIFLTQRKPLGDIEIQMVA